MAGCRRLLPILICALPLCLLSGAMAPPARAGSDRAAGLVSENLFLEVEIPLAGRPTQVRLQAALVKPPGTGPFPLAVINHGAPRKGEDRAKTSPRSYLPMAAEFARRGWAVLLPIRRGYGLSDGPYGENSGPCSAPDYVRAGHESARDIAAAIRAITIRPDIDRGRILLVGRSAGGLASVALGADPPTGVRAVINFAGGRGSAGPDQVCDPTALIEAMARFGRTSRLPELWVYSENDHFFGPNLARAMYRAFTEAGGRARLNTAPPFGTDGHSLFSAKGIPVWAPMVDDFLTWAGLGPGGR